MEEIYRKAITTALPHSIILVGRLVGRLLNHVEDVYRKAITTARPHSIIFVGRLVGRLLDQVE